MLEKITDSAGRLVGYIAHDETLGMVYMIPGCGPTFNELCKAKAEGPAAYNRFALQAPPAN